MAKASNTSSESLYHWLPPTISTDQAKELSEFLSPIVGHYQHPNFITPDPISVPRSFRQQQDQEIMGLFAALFAWGRRDITLAKCADLTQLLCGQPYEFIMAHQPNELKKLTGFKHRTFNQEDLSYFLIWFRWYYENHSSLEEAFLPAGFAHQDHIGPAIANFHQLFFSQNAPIRTRKHVSSPASKSACKRLSMFLRWMIRPHYATPQPDGYGVDLGIWKQLKPHQLINPLDVHVLNNAKAYGLINSDKSNWVNAVQLTSNLRMLDPNDPVKYDFALFGLGAEPNLSVAN